MARSVCRAARAALRGRELRGAKVQVVWHGAGGGGALGRGLEGRRGRALGGFMRCLSAGCAPKDSPVLCCASAQWFDDDCTDAGSS